MTALCDTLSEIAEQCGDSETVGKLRQQINDVFSRPGPSIMFYGLYNAGKSTMINAIFGREIALTGDIPTTSGVQRIP